MKRIVSYDKMAENDLNKFKEWQKIKKVIKNLNTMLVEVVREKKFIV